MSAPATAKPSDLTMQGLTFDMCVLGHVDDGIEGSVCDASRTHRATAQANFARELGVDFADVECRTRWARFLTRQEVWDDHGRERWEEQHCVESDEAGPGDVTEAPDEPPADWQAEYEDPVWTFCAKGEPAATRIYVFEERVR